VTGGHGVSTRRLYQEECSNLSEGRLCELPRAGVGGALIRPAKHSQPFRGGCGEKKRLQRIVEIIEKETWESGSRSV